MMAFGRRRIVTASFAAHPTPYALSLQTFANYRLGQEFRLTASKTGSRVVQAYLLGHALELFLKSFLMKAGFTIGVLKDRPYGHALVALLAAAKKRGLDSIVRVTPRLERSIAELAAIYPRHLRYFSVLDLLIPARLPELRPLLVFTKAFDEALKRHVAPEP